MKTQYYYIGKMTGICSRAIKNKANPFPLKEIQSKVVMHPDECVKLCERFKPELQGAQLEAFEKAHSNFQLVSLLFSYDKYEISATERKRDFRNGFNFRMPRGYFLGNILIWLVCLIGIFVASQYHFHFYKNQFSSAVQKENALLAKTLLTCSFNPKETISSTLPDSKITDPGLLKKMLKAGYNPSSKQISDWYQAPEILKFFLQNGGDINKKAADESSLPILFSAPNVQILDLILEEGKPDFTAKCEDGTTIAFHAKSAEVLDWLEKHGVDMECKDGKGQGIFESYIHQGDTALMQYFVDRKYDFNQNLSNGKHCAFGLIDPEWDFHPELTAFMIQNGTDVNAKDEEGNTPLHLADSIEKKQTLLENGADFMAENEAGLTPLEYQLQGYTALRDKLITMEEDLSKRIDAFNQKVDDLKKPHSQLFSQDLLNKSGLFDNDSRNEYSRQYLLNQMNASSNNRERSALEREKASIEEDQQKLADMEAELQEYAEIINVYVDQKCDVAAVFQRMIAKRQDEFIPIFCASKLDLNALGYEGKTFLQGLIEKMEAEVEELRQSTNEQLLATSSEREQDKIHVASIEKRGVIEMYYVKTMARLVEKGADINQKNSEGSAIIHLTTQHYLPRITEAVLIIGAETNIEDAQGNTPLHYAASNMLVQYTTDSNGNIVGKQNICDTETMHSLIEKGAKIDVKNAAGKTPLHLAASYDCIDSMELLLEDAKNLDNGKKSLEIEDEEGFSPMYQVTSLKAFDLLKEAGFDYHKPFKDGMNLLRNAVEGDDVAFFKELQKEGLKITTSDEGETLMFYCRSPEMVRFLQAQGIKADVKNDKGFETPLQRIAFTFMLNMLLGDRVNAEKDKDKIIETCELLYELGCDSDDDKDALEKLKNGQLPAVRMRSDNDDDDDDVDVDTDDEDIEMDSDDDDDSDLDDIDADLNDEDVKMDDDDDDDADLDNIGADLDDEDVEMDDDDDDDADLDNIGADLDDEDVEMDDDDDDDADLDAVGEELDKEDSEDL